MGWNILLVSVLMCVCEAQLTDWQNYEARIRKLSNNTMIGPVIDAQHALHQEAKKNSPYHPGIAGKNFVCSGGPSVNVPASAHTIKPGDINVIAALGDSLTAASCADGRSIFDCVTEYRGTSWSIGGDRTVNTDGITLPNILRNFNPNIYGFSTGTGNRDSPGSRLNVAKSGAESRDMFGQAEMLVQRMQSDPNVNFQGDWKLITIFVGGNEMCRFCNNEGDFTSELYRSRVEQAVQVLYNNVPRAIVQLASIFNIGPVSELDGLDCSAFNFFNAFCGCASSEANRAKITLLTAEYQTELRRIASDANFRNREDFTVVLQPFYERTEPPRKSDGTPDTSFFAPDCFHFSRKGHQVSAISLWNQMFQPVGLKETEWNVNANLYCPGENEYIATHVNSKR